MTYIGIDPGKKGAMAIICDTGGVESIELFNREDDYIDGLNEAVCMGENIVCCLEHVGAMPGNGAVSMFNFGAEFGWCKGILEALKIPYELVRPQKWKKEFSITADKNTSLAVAKRLYPHADLRRTERCRKDDDNRAEALLMAEYVRRKLGGK